MAEWLRRGLQILARRFDSGSGLHFSQQCESAALAQLVEHIIRNDGVRCSSHLSGTISLYSLNHVLLDCGAELSGGRRTLNIENRRDGAGIRQPLGENG